MHRVPIVLLGFGKMGRAAYDSLLAIVHDQRDSGIAAKILCLPEIGSRNMGSAKKYTAANTATLDRPQQPCDPLDHVLREQFDLSPEDRFLVYDASPTQLHHSNMRAICEAFPNAFYLGEKPLLTSRQQLRTLDGFAERAGCAFIENFSLPMLKLSQLQTQGFEIRSLRFWRLNSSGLMKMAAPQRRQGVTGGALLDKAIHDLALTSLLLGESEGAVVEAASMLTLPESREAWAGEAAGFGRTQWAGPSGWISAGYGYSWVGVDLFEEFSAGLGFPSLRQRMRSFRLDETAWLHRRPCPPTYGRMMEQEARIAVIDGEHHGRRRTLVANFLSRPGIQPFLFDAQQGGFLNLDGPRYGANSLCRLLDYALRSYAVAEPQAGSRLRGRIVQQSHEVMFDIRECATNHESVAWERVKQNLEEETLVL